jgi:hypothetical protein
MHVIWRLAFGLSNQAGMGLLLLGSAFELGLHGVLVWKANMAHLVGLDQACPFKEVWQH